MNCLSVFDHFVILALKGLRSTAKDQLLIDSVKRGKCDEKVLGNGIYRLLSESVWHGASL